MYVHTRFLGFDIELGLHRAVRDLSQRSQAHIHRMIQQCALSSLTLVVIALTTIATIVWVVTAVGQNRALQTTSMYEPIPVTAVPTMEVLDVQAGWAVDDDNLWAVQSTGY